MHFLKFRSEKFIIDIHIYTQMKLCLCYIYIYNIQHGLGVRSLSVIKYALQFKSTSSIGVFSTDLIIRRLIKDISSSFLVLPKTRVTNVNERRVSFARAACRRSVRCNARRAAGLSIDDGRGARFSLPLATTRRRDGKSPHSIRRAR